MLITARMTGDGAAEARDIFADQYKPGAGPDRLISLIAEAEQQLEIAKARALLLKTLVNDPGWRLALLACGVPIVPMNDRGTRGPDLWEGIDRDIAAAVLRRAVDQVKAEGGPEITNPERLLAPFAAREFPLAPPII